MNDRERTAFYNKTVLEKLSDMVSPEFIHTIDEDIEGNIISLVT